MMLQLSILADGLDLGSTFLVLALILAFVAICAIMTLVSRYKRCPSNRVLVIYGKTGSGASKCVHGGAAFVWPLIQDYAYLDLEPFVVPIDLANALSQENIRVAVPTTVTAAISNQPGIMQNAAVRLLGLSPKQIQEQAQDIIVGQMRAVIATMKIEEINRDRQGFMAKVNEAVQVELEKIGVSVINVNIRDIQDESGYITALGRKAAAEAVNQANIDVAEQERTGRIGVAERQRDTRIAVAAANAQAEIGEAEAERTRRQKTAALTAEAEVGEAEAAKSKRQQVAAAVAQAEIGEADAARTKRQQTATLDAEAVNKETEASAAKAAFKANQRVAEEEARKRAESAAKLADGEIRVAQELAAKKAEEAKALRETARLNAEVVVPADAARQKLVIEAEASKQQYVKLAEGQAQATLAKMTAEAKGLQSILEGKAEGYRQLVESCGGDKGAAALLLIEKLLEISNVQAKAIQNLPIEKIIVWDGGGAGTGIDGLGKRIMGALPPMHELARQVGLDLPEFLGKVAEGNGAKTDLNAARSKAAQQVDGVPVDSPNPERKA